MFNPHGAQVTVHLPGRPHGWLVDLRGRPLEPFEGEFTLRASGIATLALAPDGRA